MKFTTKDLRAPHDCFPDKVETIHLTRGDIAMMNTVIGIMNKALNNQEFVQENMQLGMLFAANEANPGSLNLIPMMPGLFKKHILDFSKEMQEKQEAYYEKHPEKRPKLEEVNPLSPEPQETVDQVVDAEAQPSEQTDSVIDNE